MSQLQQRVCVQWRRLGPYHLARLQATWELFREHCIDLIALETASQDSVYAWEEQKQSVPFQRKTVFSGKAFEEIFPRVLKRSVMAALDGVRPSAVAVSGYSLSDARAAFGWCRRQHVPAILMSESWRGDSRRYWWKEMIKRLIVRGFSSALVGGSPQAEYATSLGVPRERIFLGYDAVDNDYFQDATERVRREAPALRQRYQLPGRYFLASCRFLRRKNLSTLITAFARYRSICKAPAWDLVICGAGALDAELRELAQSLGVAQTVHFPGFVQYPDLPVYYGLASVFVHPAVAEQWGLVVNEAMASGLPVLVSSECGCSTDLVREGVNGYTFAAQNTEQLARLLEQMSGSSAGLGTMGKASRHEIAKWGVERFAQGLLDATRKALHG